MKIKYHGHSCFSITSEDYTIVLDPYKNVNGFKDINLEANEVICSHMHGDHSYTDEIKYINDVISPFIINKIPSYHDKELGHKRGLNDINILMAEGKRIAHLGDLGHILEDKDVEKLKGVDVLMIPVGGYFTIDFNEALEIIKKIEPKHIVPMHYRDQNLNFEVLSDINEFLEVAKDYEDRMLLIRGYEEEIEI